MLTLPISLPGCATEPAEPRQGEDDGGGGSGVNAAPPAESAGPLPDRTPPSPFEIPFGDLVAQGVPWATGTVRPVSAMVERRVVDGLPSPLLSVDLGLWITNRSDASTGYFDLSTWDLQLASGARTGPVAAVGALVNPGTTTALILRYRIPYGTPLEGSALVLNGEPRGVLEPEIIPLDAPWTARFPLRVTPLVGASFTLLAHPDDGIRYVIEDVLVDLDDPALGRTEAGRRFVRVVLGATRLGTGDPIRIESETDFRIIVGAAESKPLTYVSQALEVGAHVERQVVFSIAAETRELDLEVRAYGGAVSKRFSVNLDADTVLVTSP